jgi:hypothetical protein
MLTPPLLVALPFLAWHPTDLLSDAVGYHLGLVDEAYPIAGSGLSALLLHIGVLTDPFGPAPAWATTLPATAVLLMGCWLVWSRPSPSSSDCCSFTAASCPTTSTSLPPPWCWRRSCPGRP